jgi:hypothetical protein
VVEINWRATRLRTTDEIMIEIPNRQISNITITNLSRPTRRHAMRLSDRNRLRRAADAGEGGARARGGECQGRPPGARAEGLS